MPAHRLAMPETCPQCGARLPATSCATCTELGHIAYLQDWLAEPEVASCLLHDQERRLRGDLALRMNRALGHLPQSVAAASRPPMATITPVASPAPVSAAAPASPAKVAARSAEPEIIVPSTPPPPRPGSPPPTPPRREPSTVRIPAPEPAKPTVPPPPAEPSEWDRFREATGFSWLYVLGVLFISAGLFWAVAAAGQGPAGRVMLAGIVVGLTAVSLWGGRWLLDSLGLEIGGQALLSGGAMLVSASVLAVTTVATGALPIEARLMAWMATTATSAWLVGSRRRPPFLLVANTFAAVALWDGASNLAGQADAAAWLGLFCCPVAACNLLLSRRSPDSPLVPTARRSAYAFVALAAVFLAASGGDTLSMAWLARLLGALLLGGLFLFLAHDTGHGQPIALSAATWWLAAQLLGPGGAEGFGVWLASAALLVGRAASGSAASGSADELRRWYLGSAAVLSALAVAPLAMRLVGPLPVWPQVSTAAAVAATYAVLAALDKDCRPLAGALTAATLAVFGAARLSPMLGQVSAAAALWAEAALLALLGWRLRAQRWTAGSPGRLMGWWALALMAPGLGLCPTAEPLAVPVLSLFALLGVALSFVLDDRRVLYVALVAGLEALLLASLRAELNLLLTAQIAAVALTVWAWLLAERWQPFEVAGTALMVLASVLNLERLLTAEGGASLALATVYWLVPLLPALGRRSTLPLAVTDYLHPCAAALCGALAAASLGRAGDAEPGWLAAAVWSALVAGAARRLASDHPWVEPWRGCSLLLGCALTVAAGWLRVPSGWILAIVSQAAVWLAADGDRDWLLLGWLTWLATLPQRSTPSDWPLADAAIGLGYLLSSRGSGRVWGMGLVCLALVPAALLAPWLPAEWQPTVGALTALAIAASAYRVDGERQTAARLVGAGAAVAWLAACLAAERPSAASASATLLAAQAALLLASFRNGQALVGAWLVWLVATLARLAEPGWPWGCAAASMWAGTDLLVGAGYLWAGRGQAHATLLSTLCWLLVPNYLLAPWLPAEWQPTVGALTALAIAASAYRVDGERQTAARLVGASAAVVWLAVGLATQQTGAASASATLLAVQAALLLASFRNGQALVGAWLVWMAAALARLAEPGWPWGCAAAPMWAGTDLLIGAGYLWAGRGQSQATLLAALCWLLVPNYLLSPWLPPGWQPLLGALVALAATWLPGTEPAEEVQRQSIGAVAAVWLVVASLTHAPSAPASWLTLLAVQATFLRVAECRASLLGFGLALWALAVAQRFTIGTEADLAQRGLLTAVDLVLATAYLCRVRRLADDEATGLTVMILLTLAPMPIWLGRPSVSPEHWPLLSSAWVMACVVLGVVWGRLGWQPGRQAALGLSAVGAAVTTGAAMAWSPAMDTLALLMLYAVLLVPFDPRAGLWCGHGAAVWAAIIVWPPPEPQMPVIGQRLALLSLADIALAVAVRRRPVWREAALATLSIVGPTAAALMLMPPSRPSVLGLLVLSAVSVTAAWLVDRRQLNDAGFACAWLAGVMVLYDAASHGRGDLLPYRSLDLYLAPLAVYILAVSERRSAQPAGLRLMAVTMALGSLLVSAFAGASWLHSAALFIAVAGAVAYGVLRGDLAIRYAGLAAFAAWFLVFLWREQENSRWLLIPLLVLLGLGAVWLAARQETRQRR